MKILIIEDEKWTAKDLQKTILEIEPSAEIVDVIGSVEEGLAFLKSSRELDLIFSDIQLSDGLSFEIYSQIDNKVPIIFCTAFNEYALEAFKETGIDYILKPFDEEAVEKALNKYHSLKEKFAQPSIDTLLQSLQHSLKPPTATISTLIIKKADKIIPLSVEDVALFFIEDNYVFAYTFKKEKHLVNKTLDELEAALSSNFFRVNRQQLLQRKAIKEAAQYFNRKLIVHLEVPFQDQVIIGKLKVTPFLNWLTEA